jgi:NAD(P)-dependent dehydrogenase (short-subunit alcohol dehydrogenase family)
MASPKSLEGKVAIVTGAARGMGRTHCLALAAAGADIVASDICRDQPTVDYPMAGNDELEETVRQVRALGRKAIGVLADITNAADMQALADRAIAEFTRIDILVNNAGIALIGVAVQDVTEEQWDTVMRVNLKGPWLCCKYVVPHMIRQKSGRIINIASHAGLIGIATLAPYNCSKHGVIGLTRTLAVELAPHGITSNALCPRAVDTPMLRESYKLLGITHEEAEKEWGGSGMSSDVIPPENISQIVTWLASDEARYINGRALLVGNSTGLIP